MRNYNDGLWNCISVLPMDASNKISDYEFLCSMKAQYKNLLNLIKDIGCGFSLFMPTSYGAAGNGTTNDYYAFTKITECSKVILIDKPYYIGNSIDLSANLLWFVPNGKLIVGQNNTITFNEIIANTTEFLDGSGTYNFLGQILEPNYFYNPIQGDAYNFNRCINAFGTRIGMILCTETSYSLESTVTVPQTITITFTNELTTISPINNNENGFIFESGGNKRIILPILAGFTGNAVEIHGSLLRLTAASIINCGTGIYFYAPSNGALLNNEINVYTFSNCETCYKVEGGGYYAFQGNRCYTNFATTCKYGVMYAGTYTKAPGNDSNSFIFGSMDPYNTTGSVGLINTSNQVVSRCKFYILDWAGLFESGLINGYFNELDVQVSAADTLGTLNYYGLNNNVKPINYVASGEYPAFHITQFTFPGDVINSPFDIKYRFINAYVTVPTGDANTTFTVYFSHLFMTNGSFFTVVPTTLTNVAPTGLHVEQAYMPQQADNSHVCAIRFRRLQQVTASYDAYFGLIFGL